MPNRLRTLLSCAVLTATLSHANALADSREDERVQTAAAIISELNQIPEKAIPPALLRRAYAVAIIPDMLKIGVGLAGRHGKGVLSVRGDNGWSAPVFIKLSGGSIGWQAGLQSSDLVLVFTNERGVENITRGKLTLGADASIAAGPIGRHGSAATDGKLRAEVYSYSRARGLFAGVSVEGAALRIDRNANAAYYAQPAISADTIIAGEFTEVPDSTVNFRRDMTAAAQGNLSAAVPDDIAALESAPQNASDVVEAPEEAKTFALDE
ncbi:MAG: lipid-binding SYLF domain-containing protein [Pseudomonadota bacterium]